MATIRIEVVHMDNRSSFYQIGPDLPNKSWQVDASSRQLIIGHGIPRAVVPLDNVRYYTIEEIAVRQTT